MSLFLLALLIVSLVLPAILCCFVNGWFLIFGLLGLCSWAFLLYLILEEFWHYYHGNEHKDQDNP